MAYPSAGAGKKDRLHRELNSISRNCVLCLLMQGRGKTIGVFFVILAGAQAVHKGDHNAIFQSHEFVRVLRLPGEKVRRSDDYSFNGAFARALAKNLEAAADDKVMLAR